MRMSRFHAAGWIISAAGGIVASRLWLLHLREVEQRAEEAERTREETARLRAVEERLRIARELHDSLTHSISVIQVQAGVAVHLARKRGEEVSPALLAIQEAGADAGRELRETLDSLLARTRTAGLPVTVTVTGAEQPVPPEVGQAAYRIVQEALTNVSRHASGACATVQLRYTTRTLSIQVDNDGAMPSSAVASGSGLGLIGMRERVSALGGRLQAGPQDGGGFQVHAEIPLRAAS
jgi:signal transduction histidine kinase